MILTPGKLYFINEQDVQTGMRSSYYKIGIVRDAEGRDSKNRLLEHQTGNPRKLCIVESLSMPAVEAIETNLHYLFARNRIMGEWMHFTDVELEIAINKAKELAAEMAVNVKHYELAEILKHTKSNGSKLPATQEAEEWYGIIQDLKIILKDCDDVLAQYDDYLYEAIERGIDVSGRAQVQRRIGAKKFDKNLFLLSFPELFEKYATPIYSVRGAFRVKPAKDWDPDTSAIKHEQTVLLREFKFQLRNADHSMDTGFALHEKHLGVLEIKKYIEWKINFADVNLRVMTSDFDGIEGICNWKREEKEEFTFDTHRLKEEHPTEYNACVVQAKATEVLIVEPKVAQG